MSVDDDPDLIELFTEVLKTNGYQVIGFGERRVAFEHLEQNQEEFD
jgi:DNA-binding response OmpR family regulator